MTVGLTKDAKAAIRKRDNWTCQHCGKNGRRNWRLRLHVHHIIEPDRGGSDASDNLITLCSRCHVIEHDARVKQREDDALVNDPFAFTISAASRYLGIDASTIKTQAALGTLEEVHGIVGHARLITADSVAAYKETLEEASQ